jgi:hypothetical protein
MGNKFILNTGTCLPKCTSSYPRTSPSLLLQLPSPAFKIQLYERTYNLSVHSIRCIQVNKFPLLRLTLGRDLVSSVVCNSGKMCTYFTFKSCFIIRTNPLELCSELTISRFATINQELYPRIQNYTLRALHNLSVKLIYVR